MRFVFLIFMLACVIFNLSACNKPETVKTIDWYKSHDAERNKVISACQSMSGTLENTPNCINAKKADIAKDAGKRGGLKLEPLSPADFENKNN